MKQMKNYLAEGSYIEGKVIVQEGLSIDGVIVGSLEGHEEITFESQGRIEGPVRAKLVHVKGEIQGDVFSTGKVEVLSGGRITGHITTPQGGLVVNQGGIMNTTLSVLDNSARPGLIKLEK